MIPILVTHDQTNAAALKARESQAAAYLCKPLERGEDLDRLRRALEESIQRSLPEDRREREVSHAG